MSEEILINVTPREARVGVVENGVLQEVHIERSGRRGHVGSIYCGRVMRVMPGMQAAFVDVGLERSAFLHAADMAHPALGLEPIDGATSAPAPVAPINELVHEGQRVIVQVIKDPIGSKGARLSTHLSIPSRYLVLLPHSATLGVSVRIDDEAERERLRETLSGLAGAGFGLIARTNAEGLDATALAEDVAYVKRVWQTVAASIERAQPGERVYEEPPLPLRVLRDLMHDDIEKVRVDSRETFERTQEFARQFMPELTGRVEHYPGERPIFDLYGAEDEIQKALRKDVPLKSGGYLVIDQTEAMTTIDVNTGGCLGTRNLEETVFRTNLEAAQAAARQLRLRNLGGIIIIDFIDMTDPAHRTQVMDALQRALAGDHAQTHIASVSSLGLVEMTRKRTRDSLEHLLCAACPSCEGRGFVRTPETVCHEIFREIVRQSRQFQSRELLILAHQNVIDRLLDDESAVLAELEHQVGRPIKLQVEALYGFDQYDVVLA